jgi:tetratricopeptide (TPR) repeat protein
MTVDESPSRIGNIQFDSHEGMHGLLRQYLLGCISAQLGDRTAALRYAAELESRPETSLADSPARTLAHSVRAMVDLKSGQSAEAIAKLDRAELLTLTARTRFSPFFSQSYERYLRAGALADLGRSEEALRWYRSVWMQNVFDLIYLAPSSLRQAEIYERLDRREEALKYYRQFVDLWQDADVELRPLVDTALSRMQRLGS